MATIGVLVSAQIENKASFQSSLLSLSVSLFQNGWENPRGSPLLSIPIYSNWRVRRRRLHSLCQFSSSNGNNEKKKKTTQKTLGIAFGWFWFSPISAGPPSLSVLWFQQWQISLYFDCNNGKFLCTSIVTMLLIIFIIQRYGTGVELRPIRTRVWRFDLTCVCCWNLW